DDLEAELPHRGGAAAVLRGLLHRARGQGLAGGLGRLRALVLVAVVTMVVRVARGVGSAARHQEGRGGEEDGERGDGGEALRARGHRPAALAAAVPDLIAVISRGSWWCRRIVRAGLEATPGSGVA